MKTQITALAASLASLVLVTTSARAELLFRYDFNTPETSATLSGTAQAGAAGTGLSGAPADKALDNTAGTMSRSGGGAYYEGAPGTLASFTVTLWFKTDGGQTMGATRLFDNGTQLLGFDGGDIASSQQLTFNSGSSKLGVWSTPLLAVSGEWIFVAISYDGNSGSDNLTFYVGTKGSEEQPGSLSSHTVSADHGSIDWGGSVVTLMFGANTSNGRSLDGWIDNIRFYGSANDATGALDSSAIAGIWTSDMTAAVPEPAVWTWLAGGLAWVATALRRRLTR
ncbi:MAG: cell wall anchor protein [Opitutaceae bacterium]|jgi:hypothetical protein|nr:cell wall anchor protein [Opitutaceae bacterium]